MQTADLIDLYEGELQSCETQFLNFGKRSIFWGPCITVKCLNDNVLLRKLIEESADKHILVVDGGGSLTTALIGDIVAGIAHENNWSGIVIYGAIRDSVAINEIDIGVKALGTNPRGCKKEGSGEIDIEISFGGVTIRPGNWVYCDADGLVVADRELSLK